MKKNFNAEKIFEVEWEDDRIHLRIQDLTCERVHEICQNEKYFSIYFNLEYGLDIVNLWVKSPSMQKQKNKKFKVEKTWDIVFTPRHCIYFEALYLFQDILSILRHCIYFETLYFETYSCQESAYIFTQ